MQQKGIALLIEFDSETSKGQSAANFTQFDMIINDLNEKSITYFG